MALQSSSQWSRGSRLYPTNNCAFTFHLHPLGQHKCRVHRLRMLRYLPRLPRDSTLRSSMASCHLHPISTQAGQCRSSAFSMRHFRHTPRRCSLRQPRSNPRSGVAPRWNQASEQRRETVRCQARTLATPRIAPPPTTDRLLRAPAKGKTEKRRMCRGAQEVSKLSCSSRQALGRSPSGVLWGCRAVELRS